jgi:transposase
MAYSIDLRKRVVEFVEEGGSKAEAARRFRVSGWCVHDWCCRADLTPKQHGPRRRKLDRLALRQHVAHHPEATLKERAPHFGVAINAIWYALQQVKVTHKKNSAVR